MAELAALG